MRRTMLAAAGAPSAAVGLLALVTVDVAYAQATEAAPPVNIFEVHAWRNVVDAASGGDLLVLTRYELPLEVSGSSTLEWCSRLNDTTGCSDDPPNPTAPQTLPSGEALHSFYTNSGATIRGQLRVPRVGHGLAGLYFAPGHGITWGDPDALGCVESASSFATTTQACAPVDWEAGDTIALAIADLTGPTTGLIPLLLNLQDARQQPIGTFVASNRITPEGQVFTREAIDGLARIVPDAFAAASARVFTVDVTPSSGGTDLGGTLATAVAGTDFQSNLGTVGAEYLGVGHQTVGIIGVFVVATGLAALGYQASGRKTEAAGIGAMIGLLLGSLVGYPPIEYVAATGFVLAVAGAMWWAKRQPQ